MKDDVPAALDHLGTESGAARFARIDEMSTAELVRMMNATTPPCRRRGEAPGDRGGGRRDRRPARPRRPADLRRRRDGRRLGVLDAAECPPTFNTDRVVGVIAGGRCAVQPAGEGAEDDRRPARPSSRALGVAPHDVVVGIAATADAVRARRGRARRRPAAR